MKIMLTFAASNKIIIHMEEKTKISTKVERISPVQAKKYLETSPENRITVSSRRVIRTYADAMRKGEWMLNGETIVFDEQGRLMQGHHRMMAVVESGCEVEFLVVRNVPRDRAWTTYNCGLKTNLGQMLAMKKIKNASLVAAIVNVNSNLVKFGRVFANNGPSTNASARTLTSDYSQYEDFMEDYDNIATMTHGLCDRRKILTNSWVGGIIFYLTHEGNYQMDFVQRFFETLCKIENNDVKQAVVLRNAIVSNRISHKEMKPDFLFALVVKAWNAYVENREISRMRWNKKEEYPQLILNNK